MWWLDPGKEVLNVVSVQQHPIQTYHNADITSYSTGSLPHMLRI